MHFKMKWKTQLKVISNLLGFLQSLKVHCFFMLFFSNGLQIISKIFDIPYSREKKCILYWIVENILFGLVRFSLMQQN